MTSNSFISKDCRRLPCPAMLLTMPFNNVLGNNHVQQCRPGDRGGKQVQLYRAPSWRGAPPASVFVHNFNLTRQEV